MYNIKGKNPTTLYKQALEDLIDKGDQVSPRGKLVKELRPAAVEFEDSFERTTFLAKRRINPFFQLAEALWIVSGHADCPWLCKFNANMATFSDDGEWFNAPYGERIRHWGDNLAHGVVVGDKEVDQLQDVYRRFMHDKDTRQATMAIGNPSFDNSNYLIDQKGKDIACLTGDTMIASPEGDIAIKDLVGKDGYPVYSYNIETEQIEIKRVEAAAMTKKDAAVYKITLGDGTEIKATVDHIFYLKNMVTTMARNPETGVRYPINKLIGFKQVRCDELKIGDRLPYFNRYASAGGYNVLNTHRLSKSLDTKQGAKEHRLYAEYLFGEIGKDVDIHHKNGNKQDNRAENLELIPHGEHATTHMCGNKRQVGTNKKIAPQEMLTKKALIRIGVELLNNNDSLYLSDYKEYFAIYGKGHMKALKEHFGTFTKYKETVYGEAGLPMPSNGLSGRQGNANATRIINIEKLSEVEDVYDITVEDNHNFFANNILVHNCNIYMMFKIRNNKLHLSVANRSNDVSWGLFGANLCQFTTIQELLYSWLKNSGDDRFKDLELGGYCQFTDSLHTYLEDYGSSVADEVLDYYKEHPYEEFDFNCHYEPRMTLSKDQWFGFYDNYWDNLDPFIMDDEKIVQDDLRENFINELNDMIYRYEMDTYWYTTIVAMLTYRLIRLKHYKEAFMTLAHIPECKWKILMLYFLKKFISNMEKDEDYPEDDKRYVKETYVKIVDSIAIALKDKNSESALREYLKL